LNQDFYHITDDLLVKYLLGEANEEERLLVEEWINNDLTNKRQYEDFKKIWEESRKLALESKVDEDAAWLRFKERIHAPAKKQAVVRKMRPLRWMRVAAIFILIVGAAIIGFLTLGEKPVENLVVASGASTKTDTLPDGSVITLNKNSELAFPSKFKGDTRTIALKGEAFFNVTPNKAKPFIIHVNDVTVRVVGTSFNVRSVNGVTEVIVETGVVQVSRNNKTVELKPKEKVRVSLQDSALVKQEEPEKLYNYYRSKEFVCDDTPLWKLVEVLKEAYGVNIIIANDSIRNLKLNTTFNNESLDRVLQIASETLGFTITEEKDRIILK
jgi:transmembrane sensor